MRGWRGCLRVALTIGVGLVIFGLLFDMSHRLWGGKMLMRPWWIAALLVLVALVAVPVQRWVSPASCRRVPLRAGGVAILLVFSLVYVVSGCIRHRWFYFPDWLPAPGYRSFASSGVGQLLLYGSLAIGIGAFSPRRVRWLGPLVMVVGCLTALLSFWIVSGGHPPINDDHASFLFRFQEYCATFPRVRNYNPYWNGGEAEQIIAVCGVSALGPLYALTSLFADPLGAYGAMLPIAFLIIVPLMHVWAMRAMGLGWFSACVAGGLSLGVSQSFFLWLLHYGTVCAQFSVCFTVPYMAGLYRVVVRRKCDIQGALLLAASAWFLVQWAPGYMIGALGVFAVLLHARRMTLGQWLFLAGCSLPVVLGLVARTWLLAFQDRTTMDYVAGGIQWDALGKAQWIDGFHFLRCSLLEGNPLLLFLGLGGIFCLRCTRHLRPWIIPGVVLFALLVAWGRLLVPALELHRCIMPLFFLLIMPVAVACDWLDRCERRRGIAVWLGLVVAFLGVTCTAAAAHYSRRTLAVYEPLPESFASFVNWVEKTVPERRRLLFAGPVVHYFSGHIAPMALLANREMVACDYYHFPPDSVEYECPPTPFNQTDEGVLEYARLRKVSHIVTFRPYWKERLRQMPGVREVPIPADAGSELAAFEVLEDSGSDFVVGQGSIVEATFNRMVVEISGTDSDGRVVLPYNWDEGLRASGGVGLEPFDAGGNIRLIGLLPHEQKRVVIDYP